MGIRCEVEVEGKVIRDEEGIRGLLKGKMKVLKKIKRRIGLG